MKNLRSEISLKKDIKEQMNRVLVNVTLNSKLS
jgi:hypothetical protein